MEDSGSCIFINTPNGAFASKELFKSNDEGINEEGENTVLYTRKKASPPKSSSRNLDGRAVMICRSVDDLLPLLELDAIDEIFFDESIPTHEVNYVTRWARIFKPAVRCYHGKFDAGTFCTDARILTEPVKSA